ncbi:MAG: 4-(cytidine 5'-diphospho)-2-C-methyl-D-erythritol kinase [Syntrophobacterales bacterium]|jgi:4-diphosphocytidyl-2-C-methyl-D-erythritol kinase|nr:4-(cytidine 5'-diphospho)-2-C-methyl-D-erythritol kinase [Syntrophobacterales bacterium]
MSRKKSKTKLYSPAKVNLFLEVLGKRDDGYHDLATLMQRISLFDEMEFSLREEGIVVKCPGSGLPEDERNIAYRAVRALLERAGCRGGVEIIIHKRIPMAAGLGGGSSNAASTLVVLNDLMGLAFSRDELIEIGATIGADVPFFIFEKTAWAFGIGDRLQEADNIPVLWFVLLNPGIEISTKIVYQGLDLGLTKEGIEFSIHNFRTAEEIAGGLRNDLENVAFRLFPVLADLKRVLLDHGALGSLMSGSGSTVFGIFEGEKEALKAAESLSRIGMWSVYTAHSL